MYNLLLLNDGQDLGQLRVQQIMDSLYDKKMIGTLLVVARASAFDIAWNNADKIDKVGVFSGSFWWRDKDASASDYSAEINRIMLKNCVLQKKATFEVLVLRRWQRRKG